MRIQLTRMKADWWLICQVTGFIRFSDGRKSPLSSIVCVEDDTKLVEAEEKEKIPVEAEENEEIPVESEENEEIPVEAEENEEFQVEDDENEETPVHDVSGNDFLKSLKGKKYTNRTWSDDYLIHFSSFPKPEHS